MKDALVIIDMLNDFVRPGAPLEVPKNREIVPNIQRRIEVARSRQTPVIYVCDAHQPDDPEFSRMGWPPHGVRGTHGARVITELQPGETDPIIEKETYSAFVHTGLDGVLQALNVDRLILTGCVTNICIVFTAYEAVIRGYEVVVPVDCIAEIDPEDGKFAVKQMRDVLGVVIEPATG
ncbi:MAG: cysteine hydrolase [Deltaproteobacteria bacterium]|jgi:nicotinamidase-related amidase|nr:cysteine hydrolase [Deltaproteobacteria bacterium]